MPLRAAYEAILMIRPPPRAIISGTAARQQKNGPLAFTPMIRSQVASSVSANLTLAVIPALLTRISIGPSAVRACAKAVVTAPELATSQASASADPPLA